MAVAPSFNEVQLHCLANNSTDVKSNRHYNLNMYGFLE